MDDHTSFDYEAYRTILVASLRLVSFNEDEFHLIITHNFRKRNCQKREDIIRSNTAIFRLGFSMRFRQD